MSERTETATADRPYKPAEEVADERFEDVILPEGRPPSSIADIQYLYGQFVLFGQELRVDHSLTPDQQAALTLREASELVGSEQAVVYLDVELDTNEETLTPTGTTATTLTRWHLEKTAFSHYDAGAAVDHSITQRTGQSTKPAKVAGSQLEKVTRRWADEDSIKPLAESHEDGWIISELQSLHTHDAMDDIVSDLEEQLTGRQYRLLSIRFHTGSTGSPPVEKEAWMYPADMDVLLDAMMARREHKWATKNDCESAGEAAGYVQSDDPEQTVYGMGTDPLSLYTGKKRAWMPRLNRDEAAGNHPLSDSVTKKLAAASPLLEACSQPHGLSLYHFPYFDGEQTVEKMRWLYQLLWGTFVDRQQHDADAEDSDDGPTWNTIENFYKDCQQDGLPDHLIQSLSVWSVAIQNYQADRKRALAEIKHGSIPRYIELATIGSDVAGDLGASDIFQTHEWDFATPNKEYFLSLLTSPRYFFETTVTTTDEDDVDTNQPGYRFYRQLLAGDDIAVSELLDAYTEEIDDRYRSNLEDGADYPVPSYRLIQQFTQLCVLGRADALNVDIPAGEASSGRPDPPTTISSVQPYQIPTAAVVGHETATISPMTDDETDTTPNNPANRAEAEAQAYRTMIEDQPVLADSPARRAAFTLGALITTVSGHQRGRDVQPLSAKLSPSTISKHNFEEYVTEVIELINRYATADDKQWRYTAQTSQLTEDLTAAPPEEWRLSTSDVQYHIALGMAFGAEQHDTLDETDEDAGGEAAIPQN